MEARAQVTHVRMSPRKVKIVLDLIRNKRTIDRRYPGAQPWEVVQPDYPKLQYPIPNNEWTVSGIEQNPSY